jgi:hypothetical protein
MTYDKYRYNYNNNNNNRYNRKNAYLYEDMEDEKFKEWKCFNYNLNEFIDYLFSCCKATTSTPQNKKTFVKRERFSSSELYNNYCNYIPFDYQTNLVYTPHNLKPRNIMFIGGKTIYGQRVSVNM